MNASAALLGALALAALLAGCAGRSGDDAGAPTALGTKGPDDLEAGRFYAFDHGGGDLDFATAKDGSAALVLYDAADHRVGRIELGNEKARGHFTVEGLAAGELVFDLLAANGTLDLRSGGHPVRTFLELPRHVERQVLVQVEPQLTGMVTPLNSDVDQTVEVHLLRAPAVLRVIHFATFQDAEVRVESRSGVVLEASEQGSPLAPPGFPYGTLSGAMHDENVRDGRLTAAVHASNFEGVLLLEAESYSRARSTDGGARPAELAPRFVYGELDEDQPSSFEVSRGASRLYAWQDTLANGTGCGDGGAGDGGRGACAKGKEAMLVLFDTHDQRVATLLVPANRTLEVALPEDGAGAGAWVAVTSSAGVFLGADRAPSDFEYHPLEPRAEVVPGDGSAGPKTGVYGQRASHVPRSLVPFHVEPAVVFDDGGLTGLTGFSPLDGCGEPSLALLRDGETLAVWGRGADQDDPIPADLLLGPGLEVVDDDYGPGCDHYQLMVTGYQR